MFSANVVKIWAGAAALIAVSLAVSVAAHAEMLVPAE
jgi:hypothetical protein